MNPKGEAEIHIAPYDASWPERFEGERCALSQAIDEYVVGSIRSVAALGLNESHSVST